MSMIVCQVYAYKVLAEKRDYSEFGGLLSTRFPKGSKIIFSFSDDECIYNNVAFSKKLWSVDNGESIILSNNEGIGLKVSAL